VIDASFVLHRDALLLQLSADIQDFMMPVGLDEDDVNSQWAPSVNLVLEYFPNQLPFLSSSPATQNVLWGSLASTTSAYQTRLPSHVFDL